MRAPIAPQDAVILHLLTLNPRGLFGSQVSHSSLGRVPEKGAHSSLARLRERGLIAGQHVPAARAYRKARTRYAITAMGRKTLRQFCDYLRVDFVIESEM